MFVMNYPDNRRGTRQVRVAVTPGKSSNVTEPIKIYVAGKVGTARKRPIPVIDVSKFSGDGS